MATLILCYHKVGPEAEEGRFLNVSPDGLRRHVAFLARRGFRGVPLRELNPGELTRGRHQRHVVMTFDDAYDSAVRHAPPVLEAAGWRGTFFAVPGMAESAWDQERARPLATEADLRTLVQRGHEVGNHSMTHPHLAGLPRRMVLDELHAAQQLLAAFGIRATTMCYPYGSYDANVLRVVKRFGFRYAVTLRKGLVPADAPPLELPRVVVGFRDTPALLTYKIWVRPKLARLGV
ncbi:MAG: polysaccharide deacetylase family protein [Fimbriimonadaceae bacterium]|nr:polysaccharide deacetylase family protein [Fimbriimonadaceae bacterium]